MSKVELLDFSATWCGPCKMQKPILEKVEQKLGDKVEVKVVDVDQNPSMSAEYGIQAVPTLIILKDGAVANRFTGLTSESVLLEELSKVL